MRSVYLCNSVGDGWPQFCKGLPFVAGVGVSSGSGYQPSKDEITSVKRILKRVPDDTSALELMLHVCEVVREDLFDAGGLADAWPLTTASTALAKGWHHSIGDSHGGKMLRIAAAPYVAALSGFLANDERRALVEAYSASLLALHIPLIYCVVSLNNSDPHSELCSSARSTHASRRASQRERHPS